MKSIWSIISRVGTILFTVGLAFLILSTFAQSQSSPESFSEQTISSHQFQPLGASYSGYTNAYYVYFREGMSVQNIYNVIINSNVTVQVYIIDMNVTELAPNYQVLSDQLNQTNLENLLQTESSMILWQGSVTNGTINYTPLKDGNLTILVLNPSNDTAQIQYSITYYHLFMPRVLGLQIASVTITSGLVLAVPMLNNTYRKIRMRKNRK